MIHNPRTVRAIAQNLHADDGDARARARHRARRNDRATWRRDVRAELARLGF